MILKSKVRTYEDYLQYERSLSLRQIWKIDNREKNLKLNRDSNRKYRMKRNKILREKRRTLRSLIIWLLGNRCKRCRFSDHRALQVDHVHGGGVLELRTLTPDEYNRKVLESIEKGEEMYQCLCANCNWIKKTENREVPGGKF